MWKLQSLGSPHTSSSATGTCSESISPRRTQRGTRLFTQEQVPGQKKGTEAVNKTDQECLRGCRKNLLNFLDLNDHTEALREHEKHCLFPEASPVTLQTSFNVFYWDFM
ncbi:hypothetical protein XENORESO_001016 [Xenotaenia resolanae]|uniref:Uncharacterized protein n=1 Tax=Xenotaenia resolanae TaxID=208358 RepID=A0ABV0W0Q0_9TELE